MKCNLHHDYWARIMQIRPKNGVQKETKSHSWKFQNVLCDSRLSDGSFP